MAQALNASAIHATKAVYKCSVNDSDCILFYKNSKASRLIDVKALTKLSTIHVNLDKNEYKNADYWNNKKTLDVYYVKYIKGNYIYRKIFLVDPDGMIKGSFTIRGNKGTDEGFGTGNTMDMEISIDSLLHTNIRKRNQGIKANYRDYQSKGLSLLLIYFMVKSIKTEANDDQKLYIDADGSEGFWGYLGMSENPVYYDKEGEGAGYEKVITLGELKVFVNKNKEKINKTLLYKPTRNSPTVRLNTRRRNRNRNRSRSRNRSPKTSPIYSRTRSRTRTRNLNLGPTRSRTRSARRPGVK